MERHKKSTQFLISDYYLIHLNIGIIQSDISFLKATMAVIFNNRNNEKMSRFTDDV